MLESRCHQHQKINVAITAHAGPRVQGVQVGVRVLDGLLMLQRNLLLVHLLPPSTSDHQEVEEKEAQDCQQGPRLHLHPPHHHHHH